MPDHDTRRGWPLSDFLPTSWVDLRDFAEFETGLRRRSQAEAFRD